MRIVTAYAIGDRVTIDRDESLIGVITAACVRGTGLNVTYEVSYIHNGSDHTPWIEEWRINRWEG